MVGEAIDSDTLIGLVVIGIMLVITIAYYIALSKSISKIAKDTGHAKNSYLAWIPSMICRMWLLCDITGVSKLIIIWRVAADILWVYTVSQVALGENNIIITVTNLVVLCSYFVFAYLWIDVTKMYLKSTPKSIILGILFGLPILNVILAVYFAYVYKAPIVSVQKYETQPIPIGGVGQQDNEFYVTNVTGNCKVSNQPCVLMETIGAPLCSSCKIAQGNKVIINEW